MREAQAVEKADAAIQLANQNLTEANRQKAIADDLRRQLKECK